MPSLTEVSTLVPSSLPQKLFFEHSVFLNLSSSRLTSAFWVPHGNMKVESGHSGPLLGKEVVSFFQENLSLSPTFSSNATPLTLIRDVRAFPLVYLFFPSTLSSFRLLSTVVLSRLLLYGKGSLSFLPFFGTTSFVSWKISPLPIFLS